MDFDWTAIAKKKGSLLAKKSHMYSSVCMQPKLVKKNLLKIEKDAYTRGIAAFKIDQTLII